MASTVEGKWVVPNPQVPRTFGMMNLVFGILLFLMGAGYLALYVITPSFQKQMVVRINEAQAVQKAVREKKLADLKTKEAAAKVKEDSAKTKEDAAKAKDEREGIKDEREAVENRIEPDLKPMTDVMGWNIMADVRLAVYYWVEVVSGMLLNVLMVISGVGLLRLAEWGRRMALGVAWLKIARWVFMTVFTMILVVPVTTEKMDKMFQAMQAQAQAQAGARGGATMGPMVGMGQIMAITTAITVVFSALIASVYPAICLWFLTRPPTRAACLAQSKPPEPEFGPGPGDLS